MILNLEKLCNTTIVQHFVESDFDKEINTFTQELNKFIHDWGEKGYEDAEMFNLKTESYYTTEELSQLIKQVIYTKKIDKNELYVTQLDEIPIGIAKELADESAQGANFVVTESRNTQIKIGLMHGFELIGFVSANIEHRQINLGGIYIREDYRKKGLSKRLLEPLMNKAKREDLIGIFAYNASFNGIDTLRAFERHCKKNGETNIEFYTDEGNFEELSKYATIYFKGKYDPN